MSDKRLMGVEHVARLRPYIPENAMYLNIENILAEILNILHKRKSLQEIVCPSIPLAERKLFF